MCPLLWRMSCTAQYSELVSPSRGCCGTVAWARRAPGETERARESAGKQVSKRDTLMAILGLLRLNSGDRIVKCWVNSGMRISAKRPLRQRLALTELSQTC